MMKTNINIAIWSLSMTLISGLTSCGVDQKGKVENHKTGSFTLFADESYKPLFETSIYTFQGTRLDADIKGLYLPENEIVQRFFNNETKTIAISRTFTAEEKEKLKKNLVEVREHAIAHDAVALINNIGNPDSVITIDKLKNILQGKDSLWSNGQPISLIFDKDQSANYNYLKQLAGVQAFPKYVYAASSNEEVINLVKKNKNTVGVIGVNWISDEDDPKTLDFLDGIQVMGIYNEQEKDYFKPFQAYIYNDFYPLKRTLYMITKGSRQSIHAGFIYFMTTEPGQLIILKSSLVPANKVARIISMIE